MQRLRTAFDPELSLLAEVDDRIVGHVLFSPHLMRLLDQTVPAVSLAPLAVAPAYQGRGIGGRLVAAGHAMAAAKGFAISFLLGHPGYYPRFGYRTHAYGSAQVTVPGEALEAGPIAQIELRGPTPDDVPALRALWRHDEAAVDFSLEPGPDLLDWLSPNPAVRASVYMREGEIVGYTRIHADEPARPRVFLAWDGVVARSMAHEIVHDLAADTLVLPIHASSAAAAGFDTPSCEAWAAAMACSLAPSLLDDYFARVREGRRPPGRPTWPVAFDLA